MALVLAALPVPPGFILERRLAVTVRLSLVPVLAVVAFRAAAVPDQEREERGHE